jgi:hypothetical protein
MIQQRRAGLIKPCPLLLKVHKLGIRGSGVRSVKRHRSSIAKTTAIAKRPSKYSHPKGETQVGDNLSFCLRFNATDAFYMDDAPIKGTDASKT